jgi:hypothetical protein
MLSSDLHAELKTRSQANRRRRLRGRDNDALHEPRATTLTSSAVALQRSNDGATLQP